MNDSNGDQVDLAHVAPFSLGGLEVDPPHRAIIHQGERIIVEPRAMQLLVALHEADGAILSHDDLIRRCWGGRIVGDNAIHRAVSRVRELSSLSDGRDFTIETVSGVGYALHHGQSGPQPTGGDRKVSRRLMLAGGAAAGASLLAAGWWATGRDAGGERLAETFAEAERMRRQADFHLALPPAQALYRELIAARPDHVPYRGALALLLCQKLEATPGDELPVVDREIKEVTSKALAIDPSEPMTRAAEAIRPTPFRRWEEAIAALKPIADRADGDWQPKTELALLYAEIGEWGQSERMNNAALKVAPLLQRTHVDKAWGAWSRGQIDVAQALVADIGRRWPRYHYLWSVEYLMLAEQRNFDAARALVMEEQRRPVNLSPEAIDNRLTALDYLQRPSSETRDAFLASMHGDDTQMPRSAAFRAMMFALVGEEKLAMDVLQGALLGTGPVGVPLTRWSRRRTAYIYTPLFDPYRNHPRFRAITDQLGLPRRAKV